MLLHNNGSNQAWSAYNWGTTPSLAGGDVVTAGASNAEGAWYQIITSGEAAKDSYGISIRVASMSVNAQNIPMLIDIGVDPSGGTTYTAVVSNIVCGHSSAAQTMGAGKHFFFPLFIKAGSSVAVRGQSSNTSARSFYVGAEIYGLRSRPEWMPVGSFSETIGTITNSDGTSFTPGNAADGAWASLGTTAKDMWWWQLAWQRSNSALTAEYTWVDLAWGDATNKHFIIKDLDGANTSEAHGYCLKQNLNFFECYCPIPAGSTLYVRGRCNNAPDTGYNAVAIGVGG